MIKMRKVLSALAIITIIAFTGSFTCYAEEASSTDSATQGQAEQAQTTPDNTIEKTEQPVSYSATEYDKSSGKSESISYPTMIECFAWLKGKGHNGIVYSVSSTKSAVGIQLEGYVINFGGNNVLKYAGKKVLYDKKAIAVQKALVSFGYKLKTDGYFGKQTSEAVKQFQKSVHLTADGVVGDKTYEKLASHVPDVKTAKKQAGVN